MTHTPKNILGLSQSELKTYMTLLQHHPANGSQLSLHSGVPRANIYNILNGLKSRGMVAEIQSGLFAPLPPDEFLKRIRNKVDLELSSLANKLENVPQKKFDEYIWTIKGYEDVIRKAEEMIHSAEIELYVLLYPQESLRLDVHLAEAQNRGVSVKYVSMGKPTSSFKFQIVHPGMEQQHAQSDGRIIDVVKDRTEIIVGRFEHGREDESPISWAKNHWFVAALREAIRHDFFHYFAYKAFELGVEISESDRDLYQEICRDKWEYDK